MRRIIPAMTAAILTAAVPAAAGTAAQDGHISGSSYEIAMSDSVTAKAVTVLSDGNSICRSLPPAYQVDCYRQTFRRAGSEISRYPDYSEGRKALKLVERTLNAALKEYGDRSAAPLRSGRRSYKAIRPEGIAPAAQAFKRARADAVTILLRSQGPIKVHYQRIAAVVGSSKFIIRSALSALRQSA